MTITWASPPSALAGGTVPGTTHTSRSISKRLSIEYFSENQFLCRMTIYSLESLDVEMGIYKGELRKPNWITRFRNTDLIKWVILQVKLIPKRFVHFPLILICCLLCSAAYPNILPATNSLIISIVITFVVCSKGLLHSPCFAKTKNKLRQGN